MMKDAVGRRYRRQDALGTPFCITVDHQTIEDQTVTIRHRFYDKIVLR
jgi:glycyl-tRNA synthetase